MGEYGTPGSEREIHRLTKKKEKTWTINFGQAAGRNVKKTRTDSSLRAWLVPAQKKKSSK